MNKAEIFSGYNPHTSYTNLTYEKGKEIWDFIKELKAEKNPEIPYAKGFYRLCGFCDFNKDCPKFQSTELPHFGEALEQLQSLKTNRDFLLSEIANLEESLKQEYALLNTKNWIQSHNHRFRVTHHEGRKTLDKGLLYFELASLFDDIKANQIISRCEKAGEDFNKLIVDKIKML